MASRVFDIIEALLHEDFPMGPRGLSRLTGIERSAVSRALKELTEAGAVERTEAGYIPGPRVFALARVGVAADSLAKAALPILGELTATIDESSYIFQRQGDQGSMTHVVESDQPVRYFIQLDEPQPLYAGSAGRAVLSALPVEEILEILDHRPPVGLTSHTVIDQDQILELVEEARELGYAVAYEEVIEGGWGVASPFRDGTGVCRGAVVLTGPISRLRRASIPDFGRRTNEAALTLSRRLGWVRPEV